MKTFILLFALLILLIPILYLAFIGMNIKPEPEILILEKPVKYVGLAIHTSNRSINKDVGKVVKTFGKIKSAHPIPYVKDPWAFVAVSRDCNEKTAGFTYIVGDVVSKMGEVPDGLNAYEIPAMKYAVFPVRPRSRFAWGIAMGRIKRYIYTEWMPRSGYRSSQGIVDFELHDYRSLGKHPEINLYVAVQDV